MTALERLRATGIRRVRAGKGFAFRTARGKPVAARELPRIRRLAIPPAWTDVFVSPLATAKLQAVGKDRAGRWQYRYHPRFRERQDQRKFEKLVDFADALPKMRRRVARDIRSRGLGQDKVMACAIGRPRRAGEGAQGDARDEHRAGLKGRRPRRETRRLARTRLAPSRYDWTVYAAPSLTSDFSEIGSTPSRQPTFTPQSSGATRGRWKV